MLKIQEAPGALELVRSVINTWDLEAGTDAWQTPDSLYAWLRAHDLLSHDTPVDGAALARAIAVREALRALAAANTPARLPGPGPEADVADSAAVLNEAAQRAGVRLRFAPDVSAGLRPSATGVDGAIGVVLSVTAVAMVEGTWNRLKVCPAPDCRWAFYDGSKNRGGVWCQMAECGNRHKVRAHRSRQASAVQP